ncbi:hypothetical protein SI65_00346 [Aspergillus cristatus]|uniref:Uncharacterized protein n=1 Tax=Aspergillus cristatus TaxID=573508 RepID=A0A1E3BPD9_ASPCR|nr:hypothetical protein SI65_00346 [Aspergillus cristatus]
MASSTGNSSPAATTKSKPQSKSKSKKEDNEPPLSANFARSSSSMIGYDHEVYLQLIAGGKSSTKTANQVYREERTRHLTTRALDPAILEPRGDPSSVDFECAEYQRKKDRVQ